MSTREQIYGALFSLLQTLGPYKTDGTGGNDTFKTVTREVSEVQTIPVSEQPVLMQYEMDEENSPDPNRPTKRTWECWLIIGATTQKGTPGATVINPLIDAVEAVLSPSVGQPFQTLNGTTFSCRVRKVIKDIGDNSPAEYRQAAASIQVEILSATY